MKPILTPRNWDRLLAEIEERKLIPVIGPELLQMDLGEGLILFYQHLARELAERLDLRVDFRQYLVFSVQGLAEQQLAQQIEDQTGVAIPQELKPKDNTVQYNEFSIGVSVNF